MVVVEVALRGGGAEPSGTLGREVAVVAGGDAREDSAEDDARGADTHGHPAGRPEAAFPLDPVSGVGVGVGVGFGVPDSESELGSESGSA